MAKAEDLDQLFNYHRPTAEQANRYGSLRSSAKAYAEEILALCPESPERTLAIRSLHQASMLANASIACNEPDADQAPAPVYPSEPADPQPTYLGDDYKPVSPS